MENNYLKIYNLLLQETNVNDPTTRRCIKPECKGLAYQVGRAKKGFRSYTCPDCAANFSVKPKPSGAPKQSAGPDYWSSVGGMEQAEKDSWKLATPAEIQKLVDRFKGKK